jgi:hypothetical protein
MTDSVFDGSAGPRMRKHTAAGRPVVVPQPTLFPFVALRLRQPLQRGAMRERFRFVCDR